ncbi:PEP-CTERM sorting domain-containing protein [Nostoc sp.]|uniref:PEP-CTERM sorting domain-containing protein n=1 Tax=Nostoc sp. TaxID=1180 RepID=UPI003FA60FCD
MAQNGAVTLDTNSVSNVCDPKPREVPEPDSLLGVLGSGLVGLLFAFKKRLLSCYATIGTI